MGSLGAMAQGPGAKDRYFQSDVDEVGKLVPEGIEGRVPYRGSLHFNIASAFGRAPGRNGLLRSADLQTLQSKAKFVRITNSGLAESHPHDIDVTKEAPELSLRWTAVMADPRPVLILDYGSQYTQLITRRVRELGIYSLILPGDVSLERVCSLRPTAVILSGGPSSIYDEGAPILPKVFWSFRKKKNSRSWGFATGCSSLLATWADPFLAQRRGNMAAPKSLARAARDFSLG